MALNETIERLFAPKAHIADKRAQMREYVRLLDRIDWSHEFHDAHSGWRSASATMHKLRHLQTAVDPGFVVWNAFAPEKYSNGARHS